MAVPQGPVALEITYTHDLWLPPSRSLESPLAASSAIDTDEHGSRVIEKSGTASSSSIRKQS